MLVLSDYFDWDKDGVDILGTVPINTGSSFIQFPLKRSNLKYLRQTTSTAVYVSIVSLIKTTDNAKHNICNRVFRQYRGRKAKLRSFRIFYQS